MNIEPCPFCEEEVRFDLGDLSARCGACYYTGPTDDNEAAAHNRLSRIVRAAEAWAERKKALNDIPPNPNIYHFDKKWEQSKIELQYAEVRLLVAVEGGNANAEGD